MLGYCKIAGSHLDNNHSSVSQMSASVLVVGVTTNLYRDAGIHPPCTCRSSVLPCTTSSHNTNPSVILTTSAPQVCRTVPSSTDRSSRFEDGVFQMPFPSWLVSSESKQDTSPLLRALYVLR
ncbi:hypothetical protein BJX66DRAFT_297861 [Aspergillus keveii]|uniref:Uncharacterized protein n=1 Tax=Aspergillus keveii TaxID=714993 RepID=A0ABR4GEK5_9EURO